VLLQRPRTRTILSISDTVTVALITYSSSPKRLKHNLLPNLKRNDSRSVKIKGWSSVSVRTYHPWCPSKLLHPVEQATWGTWCRPIPCSQLTMRNIYSWGSNNPTRFREQMSAGLRKYAYLTPPPTTAVKGITDKFGSFVFVHCSYSIVWIWSTLSRCKVLCICSL
jgi:hypothetical protein